MEKRKENISARKICRFCLTDSDTLANLYDRIQTSKDSVNLHLKILTCISVEVFPSDKMPCYICQRCNTLMNLFYEYKHIVRQADENILHYIQTGTTLEPIKWSSSLIKASKTSKEVIMKTVVEGGATVQVSSQDASDSEEEEYSNVYNVKIGDGIDSEEKTACIKVVSAKASDSIKPSRTNKEAVRSEKNSIEGCWPCDECDCTYPLQQLLDLHKTQKHRARTVKCDKCDAKFFNKYDLSTHLVRHSDEMPFQCVACGKRFKRNILLKRHEKFIHADLPQHVCSKCPASFLSLEEFKAHKKKHIHAPRPYPCSQCDKTFNERGLLQRHKDVVHNKTLSFHCEYCPERFSSVTKLARHVRGHAGVRPYPCKFCDKSFIKSHHYTRHLRVRHRNEPRAEEFRCEQCDITFSTQDELIYHSAIHATQSLTCPLCQEKFEDVDAVTTHIKSHVTGDEFMCDFCELVFTAREKLDAHMICAHEEEMQQDVHDEAAEMEAEDEDEDNAINVKEEDENNMVIEIKKPDEFLIKGSNKSKNITENANSEESEAEAPPIETPITTTVIKKPPITILSEQTIYKPAAPVAVPVVVPVAVPVAVNVAAPVTIEKNETPSESPKPPAKKSNTQLLDIVWSEEEKEPKLKPEQHTEVVAVKKEKPLTKVESSSGVGDKTLRLLEKELQDLKRTNSSKTPAKPTDANLKNRRPLHTSTPKLKSSEEKKSTKGVISKKVPTKENKEPKEVKEKEPKTNGNEKEEKESKSLLKNGGNSSDKSADEGVRRSTRPSKIRNYAKMVRDKPQAESDDDTEDDDDEEYTEVESRPRGRRPSVKQSPKPAAPPTATPAAPPRKRGRPRKDVTPVPAKVKKESEGSDEEKGEPSSSKLKDLLEGNKPSNSTPEVKSPPPMMVYPGGQTLKKVPMKALPPGVKPLPLPANARPVTSGDLCEMQIGKKVVKVQKIVMTRAEVEAMAKKGLVEMKDGTMVLKQGIKLPTSDPANIKSTLVGETSAPKEASPKKDIPKAAPTRCDLDEV
ncbi:zinc finger and BTB domain-containing protein 41-like isoform X2 [Aricia agestis]|uniref:zinc finger and BTB domain-containing protein 41-like isoform X2 n=1 Tax=Aricia agestis TaxID=91739 RepID=UPI001C20290E|nr:zinc finger and BTB domain-containing protein 41-like isoform X2 [Aricia agestis]